MSDTNPQDPTPAEALPERAYELVIDKIETLKVLFDPMRSQILRAMAQEPRTVHQIADELGVPFTRLYYHVNMLEKHGLIRMVDARALGGAVEEKYYQAVARSFVVARDLLTLGEPEEPSGAVETILGSILDWARDDIRSSIRSGRIDLSEVSPHPDSLLVRRAMSRLSRRQVAIFHQRVQDLLQDIVTEESDEDNADYYVLALALYPSESLNHPDLKTADIEVETGL